MRALVQRVTSGQVDVRDADGKIRTTGKIGKGMVVLFGVSIDDKLETAAKLADKCAALRCFEDENGKINLDIKQIGGEIIVVSQFTLYADTSRGNRPSFSGAARPELAIPCYEAFVNRLQEQGITVFTGEFGAEMHVDIQNDGPVTLMLEL
ncbi:MAG: D-tyrosyl-tRNA(Tyr) deacylase [Lentisphaerae bacterium]|nr:D-tyrosyl-tRNA(Tyr) deacylase [Lentisphaerota bacterium]